MRHSMLLWCACSLGAASFLYPAPSRAEEDTPAQVRSAAASAPASRATGASAPINRVDAQPAPAASAQGESSPVRFATEAKWQVAGYNNNEIVYTILLTNQDTKIIRCTTEIKGSYFENGEKLSISDRQITTVLPDQQAQVGNWMGMDEQSGATYSVKCRAL